MRKRKLKHLNMMDRYVSIEDEFFEIDKESKVAKARLCFDSPDDIFDRNYNVRKPVLNEDFIGLTRELFGYVPNRYKIDLTVQFKDMKGMTEQELKDIYNDNLLFEYKARNTVSKHNDRTAIGLIVIGVLLFFGMLVMKHIWPGDSILKDICTYVADIATTVTFWEALYILVVVSRENLSDVSAMITRFSDIHFETVQ
ncbi:MAG: hypothetical protein IJ863_02810 [Spirochaetales bacterium]|nr:hypothetical protein [Spirochaetales bacterium]